MAFCGLCEHFDQTRTGKLYHTCKRENPRKVHDPAADACDKYRDKSAQTSILDMDARARGAFRAGCEL